jgi:hypothetical protein
LASPGNGPSTVATPRDKTQGAKHAVQFVGRSADRSHFRGVRCEKGELVSRQKSQVAGSSAAESDRYEELFVNPTLLKLARQRGDLDCGGARFVLVGYGNFHQLVIDLPDGHVSVCFELGSAPLDHWEVIRDIFPCF